MGARALSERDYQEAADHFALVTEHFALDKGTTLVVRTQLFRALALGLLGKMEDARQCLNAIDARALPPSHAYSLQWLGHFLQDRPRPAEPAR